MKIHIPILLSITVTFLGSFCLSHPGRTDSNGGHYDKSASMYHCHDSACSEIVDTEANEAGIKRYNRKDWRHWIDEDGDCQNTRAEILISQSELSVEFATSRQCRVVKGSWLGGLTGVRLLYASDVDIDHVIPLSYAHRHGGASWSAQKKEQFANDPLNLLPTYDMENREKSDKGPSGYLPPNKNLVYSYIKRWQAIGVNYDLSIASDDMVIIRDIISCVESLQSC
tara:strand:+ start:797 stop:1474 length:678 start_codon:yes stop_codon:yes gene_type:complete